MGSKIFLDKVSGSVAEISEKPLISRILKNFGNSSVAKYPEGAGDDCAVLKKTVLKKHIYVTADTVICGVHFAEDTPAILVGRKLVSRNVSDIASMGGRPVYAIITAQFSKNLSLSWLDEFCRGVGRGASKMGLKIVGGDIAHVLQKNFFCAQMTLFGDSSLKPLLRTGSKVGDLIFTTGSLGLSFESQKHLTFSPRLAEGEFLASKKCITSCIDLSDGVASDLRNLLSMETCAELDAEKLPRRRYRGKVATIKEALCGGEDYELLFTARGDGKSIARFIEKYRIKFGKSPYLLGKISFPKTDIERGSIILCGSLGNAKSRDLRSVFRGDGYSH